MTPSPPPPAMPHAPRALPALAVRPLLAIVAVNLALHAACLTQYGWFRDELYYMTCANHPAAGYVDQPPLSIWLLGAWRAVFGESLFAVRSLAALAGAALVFATGALTRRLGGGVFAQCLAALAVALTPVLLAIAGFYSMNVLDQLLWSLAIIATIRAMERDDLSDWALLGSVIGIGLLNKISILWLVLGQAPSIVVAALRHRARWSGVLLAAGIACAMFAPHVVWQVMHGWPTLTFMHNASAYKMVAVSPGEFVKAQIMQVNPLLLPLWLAGLAWCLWPRRAPVERLPALVFLVTAALLLAARTSRPEYLAAAYPPLFAAGAIAIERATRRRGAAGRWGIAMRAISVVFVIATAIPALPMALPLLPVERFISYSRRLGLAPHTDEHQAVGPLPQHYADMFGWPELANEVARVYHALPEAEQRRCVIFGQNYGEAGAICVLGKPLGLPPAISGHNAFWMWGPGPEITDPVVIVIGGDESDERRQFARVERAGTWTSRYAMPYERGLPIWVCRGLRIPLRELWPEVRHYI